MIQQPIQHESQKLFSMMKVNPMIPLLKVKKIIVEKFITFLADGEVHCNVNLQISKVDIKHKQLFKEFCEEFKDVFMDSTEID